MTHQTTIKQFFVSSREGEGEQQLSNDANAKVNRKRKLSSTTPSISVSNQTFLLLWNQESKTLFPQLLVDDDDKELNDEQPFTWISPEPIVLHKVPFDDEHKVSITLKTNFPVVPNPCNEQQESDSSFTVIKSMIQKGVRRRLVKQVCNLATYSCHSSWNNFKDLLRRIPVIALEDVTLHPGLPIINWIMMAFSRGFHPKIGRAHV